MKRILLLSLVLFSINISTAQIIEQWNHQFEANFSEGKASSIKMDSNDALIIRTPNHIMKYNTLGELLWKQTLESAPYDTGGIYDEKFCIDDQNNIYVISKEALDSESAPKTAVNTRKFSSEGDLLWTKNYQNNESPFNREAAIDMHNNAVYITGITSAASNIFINPAKIFLCSYNSDSGEENWQKTYQESKDTWNSPIAIKSDAEGYIYIGGNIVEPKSGSNSLGIPKTQYLLLKYDAEGNLMWENKFRSTENMSRLATEMVLTKDDRIVLSGYYYTTVSYSFDGEFLWEKMPPSQLGLLSYNFDRTYDMIALDNGDLILTGKFTKAWDSPRTYDIIVLKITADGGNPWKTYYLPYDQPYPYSHSLTEDQSGNIIVAGYIHPPRDEHGDIIEKPLLFSLKGSTGQLLWERYKYDESETDTEIIHSIYSDKKGTIYTTGNKLIGRFTGDLDEVDKRAKFFSLKKYQLDETSTGSEKNYIIYPNPSSNYYQISTNSQAAIQVEMSDAMGKLVYQHSNYPSGSLIQLQNMEKGVYFVKIQIGSKQHMEKMIVYH